MEQPASSQLINQNTSYADGPPPVQESWFKRHRRGLVILLTLVGIPAAIAGAFFVINELTPAAKSPALNATPLSSSGGTDEFLEINSNLLVHGTINGVTNLVGTTEAQVLINKSLSGLNNTFSNIPVTALTGGLITIVGSNGITGGQVGLGGTLTLGFNGSGSGTTINNTTINPTTLCPDCVLNDTSATSATQTIAPTADIPSLAIRQTTAAGPASDIFNVTDSAGSTKYVQVGSNGSITLNPGGGSLLFGKDTTPSALTFRGGQAVGTDAPGSNITLDASNGTGAGGSGDFIFRTASNSGSLVQLDSGSVTTVGGTLSNTMTIPDSVAANNNRIMFISIVPTSGTVTGATWNGVAMTLLASEPRCTIAPFANCGHEVWYLLNPASGSHNVVITMSTTGALNGFAEVFYNVQQTPPTVQSQSGTAASFSQDVPTDIHELVFDSVFDLAGNVPTSGQSTLQCSAGNWQCEFSQVSASPTTTLSYTTGFSSTFSQISAVLIPVPATGPDPLLERLRISMSGNIGISNSAPAYPLDVVGNINTDTGYRIGGININTAGTLSNVGYLNQNNTFTGLNNITSNVLNLNAATNGNTAIIKVPQLPTTSACSSGANEGAIIQNFGGTQVGHLCINGPTSGSPNTLAFYADSFNATSTDLAENYSDYTNSLDSGDVVTIDSSHVKSVTKSSQPYDPDLLGVISTSPGLTLTGIDEKGDTDLVHPKPVALSGRVPVKYSNENGPVKAGDYLTASSSKPGYAMRATRPGRVIGIALGSPSSGKVLTFINPGYYNPDQTNLTSNGTPTAPTSPTDPTFNSLTSSVGTFQTLNIGKVTLTADQDGNLKLDGNLLITGNLSVSQDLTLNGSLNAPNGLALNIGPGKSFTVSSNGQTRFSVNESGISADKLSITGSSGLATIQDSSSTVTINSPVITSNSQIIISFEGDFAPATHYWIDQKVPGRSFRLNLDHPPAHAVPFAWWVIN